MLTGGIIFILALFATYGACALIIAIRQIKRAENAGCKLTNGGELWLAERTDAILAEKLGKSAASGTRGGVGDNHARRRGTQNTGSHSHDGRGCNE